MRGSDDQFKSPPTPAGLFGFKADRSNSLLLLPLRHLVPWLKSPDEPQIKKNRNEQEKIRDKVILYSRVPSCGFVVPQ